MVRETFVGMVKENGEDTIGLKMYFVLSVLCPIVVFVLRYCGFLLRV